MKDTRFAGLAVALGGALMVGTIVLEYREGWIGPPRTPAESRAFVLEHWPALQGIWSAQAGAQAAFLAGSLLLMRATAGLRALVWALLAIGSSLALVGILLSLGAYGPALEAYDETPALFESVGGAIRAVYGAGKAALALLIPALLLEAFLPEGPVSRRSALLTLAAVLASVVIGPLVGVPGKLASGVGVAITIVIGVAHARGGRTDAG